MKSAQNQPPKPATIILRWFSRNAGIEDLEGDLEELYLEDCKSMPKGRAAIRYWRGVFSLIFSYALKKRIRKSAYHPFATNTFNPAMLRNYFLIATRNLAKHKLFTIINVIGLAVGMSISLLLIAMLSFIYTYDNFHEKKDRIYRVITRVDDRQRVQNFASSPSELGDMFKEEFAGVEQVVRINHSFGGEVEHENKKIPLGGYFADPEFLDVFTFPLEKGSASTALNKPFTLVISRKAAEKLFGDGEPMGKIVAVGALGDFEITGVLKDLPKNSHMDFEVLTSYQTYTSIKNRQLPSATSEDPWQAFYGSYTYLLLPDKTTLSGVDTFLGGVSRKMYPGKENFTASFELQPLTGIVPGEELLNQIGPEWGFASLSIFMLLTVLILLPACFNYANISISRALKRMKEIGLRKVMGGQRNQIFIQFIMETVIVTLIALCISYYLFTLIRAEFLSMLVDAESMNLTPDLRTVIIFILFGCFVGFAAGVVPALYFSKLTPIQALKVEPVKKGISGFTLRKFLIVSQFTLSLGFIMGVVIVLNQYRYAMNYDFGFDQENILDVELQGINPNLVKNEFSRLQSVQSISMSSHVLGTQAPDQEWVKNTDRSDSVEVFEMAIDENFITNLDLTILSGSNFTSDSASMRSVIVNEEFIRVLKINGPTEAIDKTLVLADGTEVTIRGVVKNFHYASLREPIRSFFFRYAPSEFAYANIKLASTDIYRDISGMESAWKALGTENKFQARFFDDEIEETYDFYFTMIKICGFLGLLAVTISCLGLLGMVVFTVENRMKEIGIRKVLGATSYSVTMLLSRDFLRLMAISAVIATPLTYFFFSRYYQMMQYYSNTIGAGEILVSLLIMLALGLTTILSQTMKASRTNPVDTLKYE